MALNIKKAIYRHNLEVREVARRMGISHVTLSRHINGNPTVEILTRISNAIGCDITELFDTCYNGGATNVFECPKCGARFEMKEIK